MLFQTVSNTNLSFLEQKLTQKFYIVVEVLPITKIVQFINMKNFAKAIYNEELKTFVVYIIALEALLVEMIIQSSQNTQITCSNPIQIAALKYNKALIKIPAKYSEFLDIFSEKNVLMLSKWIDFNQQVIQLEKSKQPPYGTIYSLAPIELETLKIYIKTHLKTRLV